MKVQTINNYSNNTTFGTKFSPKFEEKLKFAIMDGTIKEEGKKTIKKLMNDGLNDVTLDIKEVKVPRIQMSGYNYGEEALCIIPDSYFENLFNIAGCKIDKKLKFDCQYNNAYNFLDSLKLLPNKKSNWDASVSSQYFENGESTDKVASMLYAMYKQVNHDVPCVVDRDFSTHLEKGKYSLGHFSSYHKLFSQMLNYTSFAEKFKCVHDELVKSLETIIEKHNELKGKSIKDISLESMLKG